MFLSKNCQTLEAQSKSSFRAGGATYSVDAGQLFVQ